jgi:hypothetical protein
MSVIKTAWTVLSIAQELSMMKEKLSITSIINKITMILYF